MNNGLLMQALLKSAMPTVSKLVGSGKIDAFIRSIKDEYIEKTSLQDNESVEILVTTEADGLEYLNVVVMDRDCRITDVLAQSKLSDTIIHLLEQAQQ